MRPRTELLWPLPRRVESSGAPLSTDRFLRVVADGQGVTDEVRRSAALAVQRGARDPRSRRLQMAEAGAGDVDAAFHLRWDPARPGETYALRLGASGGELFASSPAGFFRGLTTLNQWLALHADAPAVPALEVEDAPDVHHRGLLLDVSRDRVPTMDTLYALVERMADWKLNQLQLYTEHTFAYSGHETVWRNASPLTADEIEALDAFCRERFIELVPNQQSFGHMHRWLVHEPYRRLAEVPEGIAHPFSDHREPFSLCPVDPRSLDLLDDLYTQLLPNFSSTLFNVGLDETIDLGLGRSAAACKERGRRAVYLDFLRSVRDLAAQHGRRIQFWADVLLSREDSADDLPEDTVPLAWGYEADHPFDRDLSQLAGTARNFYACPGTSSWMSFAGRLTNALGNLAVAARTAHASGATGLLIADWGDHGHLQPLVFSYPPLLAGAGFAWRTTSTDLAPLRLAELLDLHADLGLPNGGQALCDLADVYRATGVELRNASVLFSLLVFPGQDLHDSRFEHLTEEGLERADQAVAAALSLPGPPVSAEGRQIAREIEWVGSLLHVACRLGLARLRAGRGVPTGALDPVVRRELLSLYAPLVDAHQILWLRGSRRGGMTESAIRLQRLRDELVA